MARYIDLEELERRIKKYVKPEIPEEKAFVEYYKDECIRQGYAMPTADVVPKSEVEMLQGALKAEERHNELTMEMAQKAIQNAKTEVVSLLDKLMKDLRKRQKKCDNEAEKCGYYLEIRSCYEGESEGLEYCLNKLAKLKKKYTEEKK